MDNIENNQNELFDAGYIHIEQIKPTDKNRNHEFKHTFFVDCSNRGIIIGKKGRTVKELKIETETYITVPKKEETKDVVITGRTKEHVLYARKKIELLLHKKQPSHLITVPFNSNEIKVNFIKFRNELIKKNASSEISVIEEMEKMFQEPEKLHLTIAKNLFLENDKEKEEAIELLKKCEEEFIKPMLEENSPLNLKLKGIKCMDGEDPSKVNKLYVNIHDEKGCLQKIADEINDRFTILDKQKNGIKLFTRRCNNKVNLHVTIFNTGFRRKDTQDKYPEIKFIDATEICRDYGSIDFGQCILSSLHISTLGSTKNEYSYYEPLYKIDF